MAFSMDFWECIDIGRPELNHSQGFFRRRHSLHEKEAEFPKRSVEVQQQEQPQQPRLEQNSKKNPAAAATKMNFPKQSNKENIPSNNRSIQNRAILAISTVQKPSHVKAPAKATHLKSNATNASKKSVQPPPKKSAAASSASSVASKENLKSVTKVTITAAQHKKKTHPPQKTLGEKLFEQAETQKKHKEELAQKIKAQEEKELNFKFHAKPVPKFIKASSTQQLATTKTMQLKQETQEKKKRVLTKQQSMPSLSMIKKPVPLVPSCGDPERIKAMEEHRKRLLEEKYKADDVHFKAKPAAVLKKPAFKPRIEHVKEIDAKPFNLVLTQRLIQRSTFDKQLMETQAIKEKQKEIIMRQRELEDRKILRQKTEFKARPMPHVKKFGH